MIFKETEFKVKDGRSALLRSPDEKDAGELLQFITKVSGETDFLMRYPEEFADFTIEREESILRKFIDDPNGIMITCFLEGRVAGNCQISFRSGMKDRHRASVAIAVLREFWSLGIATRMFEEMLRLAKERREVIQIELEFIEGNRRARDLYEKMGFRITGVKPDAIRLKNGCFVNEYMMVKRL